jgi:hypothetical protein
VDNLIVEEEDIQIDDARAPFQDSPAARGYLDVLQNFKELISPKARLDLDHAVDKPVLLGIADRFRPIEGGLGNKGDLFTSTYFIDGLSAVSYLVPNVGTNADESDISHDEGVMLITRKAGSKNMRLSGGVV